MPYAGPFVTTQCFTNGTVELQYGAIKVRYNIRRIKLYKYEKNIEDISTESTDNGINI